MPQCLNRFCRLLLALAVASILPSCGKSSPNDFQERNESRTRVLQLTSKTPTDRKLPSVKHVREGQTGTPDWLGAAREDPDPRVRLHAIETWAVNPGNTFDPVTHALIDPDETVRARAQELFEEALEREGRVRDLIR
jgi:hypothetical protein